ncbi:hypothetical protein ANTPLA_LOCUS2303 [Anthophora plagiata]
MSYRQLGVREERERLETEESSRTDLNTHMPNVSTDPFHRSLCYCSLHLLAAGCCSCWLLPVLAIDPFVQLARDPVAINKGRRDAVGQSRCRAECIGFCQTGECYGDNNDEEDEEDEEHEGQTLYPCADPSLDCIKAFPK